MTPEQEAQAIGELADLLDEIFEQTDGGAQGYAQLLEIFGKAIISIAEDPQAAVAGLSLALKDADPETMARLGIKKSRS